MGTEHLRQPAEWAPHRACWLAWPSARDLWEDDLLPAQKEFTALCRAIGQSEFLEILVADPAARRDAEQALRGLALRFHELPYGDIWLRDTAPIFSLNAAGKLRPSRFRFNGWGSKYALPHDDLVASRICEIVGKPSSSFDWILEGGAVDTDGEGTLLTTEQCLLNPNRHPGGVVPPRAQVEERLCEAFGATRVVWVRAGLLNDHTDGHIDTIARFASPGTVVCMQARQSDDPNAAVMDEIARSLESAHDAQGRRLRVVRVPSPGPVLDEEGEVMPASYMNFYVANHGVVVPVYGTPWDERAVDEIAALFPGRRTVGLPAKAILSGGGAFHCITQQEPREVTT